MSLANLVQFNDQRLSDAEISDLLQGAPALAALNAIPASNGTNHRYKYESTASSAAFRAIDAGAAKTKSASTQVDVVAKILDGTFDVDVAEANAHKDGRDAYLELEAKKAMRQMFFTAGTQVFYGAASPGDTAGFTGLRDNALFDALADTATVINAGDSAANAVTSVWMVRSTDTAVSYVAGNDGNIAFDEEEINIVRMSDTTGGWPAYYVPMTGYGCLQIGSNQSAIRICNVATSGTGNVLTDDLLSQALERFPSGLQPTHIFAHRQAIGGLQRSRTATNATGAEAPRPTSYEGIPIIATDELKATEAVEV